ncbi:dye-decolorizing peroxidase YfeX-like [Mytilus galloprovincialis]|uniref:dye-decolorizing peroxidase YfeX-like n=1 Tax=Mytilus galloprovincialis TaxID=29158 RepID=UPI003F7CA8D6
MAALRGSVRQLGKLNSTFSCSRRGLATGRSTISRFSKPLLIGGLATGTGLGWLYKNKDSFKTTVDEAISAVTPTPVFAAEPPASQPSVFSQGKDHALYLWIHLKPTANVKEVGRACAKIQSLVDKVTDPKMSDESDEIWAGVGFGPNIYKQLGGNPKENYTYAYRKGSLGEMPSSGGDVFIHAKCNTVSKLFELSQLFLNSLPAGSVDNAEDIFSFVYQNGRDLSGFIDGTENPADDESRQKVAVEKDTGGSYVITQKWIHDLKLISSEKDKTMEGWVGRTRADSIELKKKSTSSHVARMTGGVNFEQKKAFEMVRQSMPFGNVTGEAGLFFIGYTASPENLNFMLDRMVGAGSGGDGVSDDIMRLTKNVKGTYWYFPGVAELRKMA